MAVPLVIDCARFPMPRRMVAGLLSFMGYAAATVVFTWPLASRLSTHVLGTLSGDTGLYLWNLWSFGNELSQGRHPFFTTSVFALAPPVNLALHNYTALAGAAAMVLLKWLDITAVYNAVLLLSLTLNGFFGYLLALRLTGRHDVSWAAGLLFGFSPFVIARTAGHLSLVAVAPLAAFWLSVDALRSTGRYRAAVGAGASLAWALYSDPYYLVYCVMLAAIVLSPLSMSCERRAAPGMGGPARLAGLAAGAAAVLAGAIWVTGGWTFRLGPLPISVRGVHNPIVAATVAGAVWWALRYRWRLGLAWQRLGRLNPRNAGVACASALLLLAPWLSALWFRVMDGAQFSRPLVWRSSVPGADLLAFILPNPKHPLMRPLVQTWFEDRPGGIIENVVSVSLVALVVILAAAWRRRVRFPTLWVGITLGFAVLALGPFLTVGGVNTHVPLPWYLLRLVPMLGAASTPTRFAAGMMLGLTALFALALAALAASAGPRRRVLIGAASGALVLELLPAPRVLHAADVPDVFAVVAADPRPVSVLHLPFGFRDGTKTIGYYNNARQYYQTFHEKRLIGGYISRLSRSKISDLRRSRILRALVLLGDGVPYLPPPRPVLRERGAAFVRRVGLGYVVVNRARTPPALLDYAVASFALERVGGDATYDLYRTTVPFDPGAPPVRPAPPSSALGVTTAVSLPPR
ncbi:MAG TPA: hypothetical protein VLN08_12020 [Vicinamibacterales bacterium]|nr:hypothetical protein [Vicinamibacterales bacterium]